MTRSDVTHVRVSAWKLGAKGAALTAILAEISIFLRAPDSIFASTHASTFAFMNLLLGTAGNFLLYWPICTFIVWLWRRLGNISSVVKVLLLVASYAALMNLLKFFFGTEGVISISQIIHR